MANVKVFANTQMDRQMDRQTNGQSKTICPESIDAGALKSDYCLYALIDLPYVGPTESRFNVGTILYKLTTPKAWFHLKQESEVCIHQPFSRTFFVFPPRFCKFE